MARLPKVGEEEWGEILNEFLLVEHNLDGTQRKETIEALVAGTINLSDLNTVNPTNQNIEGMTLSNDGTKFLWKTNLEINVRDFGATGDGVTDDTAAIQAAIDAAGQGGSIIIPRGVFKVTHLKVRNHGTAIVGAARYGTRIVRHSGTLPLIEISGSSSVNNHARYTSITNLMIAGNNMPGVLLQSYYSDTCIYRDVSFFGCDGLATDLVEVWDTRFYNCSWENCGSMTEPAMLICNSRPAGEFGFSNDNSNQIHFLGCRWEGWRNGALRLHGAHNGSTDLLNGIFLVSCKMESSVAAGTAFQIMQGSTMVFVTQLYIAIMAAIDGYNTPIDAIEDRGSQIFMTDVYVQWGPATGLANSVLHIWSGGPHMYHKLNSFFPTEDPKIAAVIAEPDTDSSVARLWTNRGVKTVGNVQGTINGSPRDGYRIRLDNIGTFQVHSIVTAKDLIKVDNNASRPALITANSVDVVGFSDNYLSEKWRIIGASGGAKFAAGKFQIEPTKGYVGINATPFTGIAMLIRPAVEGDRGVAVVRPTNSSLRRLMEFQDETYNIQGMAFDSNGRPQAVGTPPRVTAGEQMSYANPRVQVRDVAGGVIGAVKATPAAGTMATITFSRPYAEVPLSIMITDQSTTPTSADLYVSDRTATSFTVSTRTVPRGGAIVSFDYVVIA